MSLTRLRRMTMKIIEASIINININLIQESDKKIMCRQLRQIYDKKSPIFIAQIMSLICTIIISSYACTCFPTLSIFYKLIMIVSACEIFLKSIGLAIVHAFDKECANTLQTIFVVFFIIIHIGLWVYSIILFNNAEFDRCKSEEPHYFFIHSYMFMYGIILVGSLALFLILLLPVTVVTIFSFRKKENDQLQE